MYKIKNTYMDKNAIKMLDTITKKSFIVDTITNKISYNTKKETIINIDNVKKTDTKEFFNKKEKCETKTTILDMLPAVYFNYNIDEYTNCMDGKFHEWDFRNDKMVCNLCNIVYENIGKDHDGNISRVNDLKMLILRKLASTYCMDGTTHEIDITTGICNKCKKLVATHNYTKEELNTMEKKLTNINTVKAIEQIETIKKYFEKENERRIKVMHLVVKNTEQYIEKTNNKMINYIDDFINILILNVGNKIKIEGNTIYLRDTTYIIKNDYLGNSIKNDIIILSSENKIFTTYNHPYFKTNVIYYHDKNNNTFVFYDNMTKNYKFLLFRTFG
jgi:hypothetical protein